MKIERDKVYLTRCGEKVRVVCTDAPGDFCIVFIDAGGAVATAMANGMYRCDGNISNNDLVSEYVEPPKPREVVVAIWDNADVGIACWAQDADKAMNMYREAPAKLVKFREVIA